MKKQRLIAGLLISVLSFILIVIAGTTDFVKSLELKIYDYRLKYKPQESVNNEIYLIAIDDKAIELVGRWPWSRKYHALLLKNLSKYPPKCIAFDILFTESEKNDEAMAYYNSLIGNIVYAGYIKQKNRKFIYPVNSLRENTKAGFINAPSDIDGVIRRVPLVKAGRKGYYPSFVLQALCDYYDYNFRDVEIKLGEHIKIPGSDVDIPIDKSGGMVINFAGDQHAFKEFSFPQVLSWNKDENKLKEFSDKLVLVALTATGEGDRGAIPLGNNIPLITVHLNALNTVMNKSYITSISNSLVLFLIILLIIVVVLVNITAKPLKAAGVTLCILIALSAVNYLLFLNNIYINYIQTAAAVVIPFVLITLYRYEREEKQKRWIRKVFGQYLSKNVIKEILDKPEKLVLGGEERSATVLFLDICNFTGFCEERSAKEVVQALNSSFDWITGIILKHGGMLDKYMGDAIMSIFGAPAEMEPKKQAKQSVEAAVEIVRECSKKKDMHLSVGIGINTGQMVVGNMGSSHVFDYTAIGDEVNVGMRVEQLTRKYKRKIIITGSVYRLIKDDINCIYLDKVNVKGRAEPVEIYSPKVS